MEFGVRSPTGRLIELGGVDPVEQLNPGQVAAEVFTERADDPLVLMHRQPDGVGSEQY